MPISARTPQRTIQAAIFDGEIGLLTARELIKMQEDQWGLLRDRITDYNNKRPSGLLCKCMMCGAPVFIRARKKNGQSLPLYSHFKGGGEQCPWHHGANINPDQVRAEQYRGQQESWPHRLLCEQIDAMARLDERYIDSTINAYRPPTESEHGRFPDVAVKWRGFTELVFEVQLSKTFQTEISARCTHYEREAVALLWVLYDPDLQSGNISQCFVDVIRRHRGNAFVIDQEAIVASKIRKTIILKCYLRDNDGTFNTSRLISLDDLKFPNNGLPFFEDCISQSLKTRIDENRRSCFNYLRKIEENNHTLEEPSYERQLLIKELRSISDPLSFNEVGLKEENDVLRLIAVVFSIIATANGKFINYANKHKNIPSMLNTLLHLRGDTQRYALILEYLLDRTPLAHLLSRSVGKHIMRAKGIMEGNLCLEHEPEWSVLRHLVPEIFDPIVRDELTYLSVLPRWANN